MQVMKISSNDAINGNRSYMLGNNILFNVFPVIFRFGSEYVNYSSETN